MLPSISPEVEACAAHDDAMHSMDILGFVDAQRIPAVYFSTPYRLSPAPGGEQLYALLCEELQRRGKIGIAHVELHARQQLAALVPQGGSLMLTVLHWANDSERPSQSGDEWQDLLDTAVAELAAPHAFRDADAIATDAMQQPLHSDMPALAEYAMKDRENAEFALEGPELADDDEDCLEERYLAATVRRARHPRDGYAMRGTGSRRLRFCGMRSRKARGL